MKDDVEREIKERKGYLESVAFNLVGVGINSHEGNIIGEPCAVMVDVVVWQEHINPELFASHLEFPNF